MNTTDLTPEEQAVYGRLAATWTTSPIVGRILAAAEIPDWCEVLAPVVAQMLAEAELEAVAHERERIARAVECIPLHYMDGHPLKAHEVRETAIEIARGQL